jgi:hypothetical protein
MNARPRYATFWIAPCRRAPDQALGRSLAWNH